MYLAFQDEWTCLRCLFPAFSRSYVSALACRDVLKSIFEIKNKLLTVNYYDSILVIFLVRYVGTKTSFVILAPFYSYPAVLFVPVIFACFWTSRVLVSCTSVLPFGALCPHFVHSKSHHAYFSSSISLHFLLSCLKFGILHSPLFCSFSFFFHFDKNMSVLISPPPVTARVAGLNRDDRFTSIESVAHVDPFREPERLLNVP